MLVCIKDTKVSSGCGYETVEVEARFVFEVYGKFFCIHHPHDFVKARKDWIVTEWGTGRSITAIDRKYFKTIDEAVRVMREFLSGKQNDIWAAAKLYPEVNHGEPDGYIHYSWMVPVSNHRKIEW